MAWSAATTFTQLTAVATTWTDLTFGGGPNIALADGKEVAAVKITADNESGTITDSLLVRFVASMDGGVTYDDHPIMTRSLTPATVSPESWTFVVLGVPDFKVQVASDGATDTYTVDGSFKTGG